MEDSDHDRRAGPVSCDRAPRSPLEAIEAHWRDLRAKAFHLPHRDDLDPSRIAAALPHAFVLEKAAPGVARLAIAGRALSDFLGTEARGLPLSVFFAPASREALRRWLQKCLDAPAVLELTASFRRGAFRPAGAARALLLPMLDREGNVTQMLGGLVTDERKQGALVKLDLDERPARIQLLPPGLPAAWTPPPTRRPAALAEARRPFLRLVVDND